MIKYVIVMAGMVVLTAAQRPPYAGRPSQSYLEVLPQYLPATEQSTPGAQPEIKTRLGEEADSTSTKNNTPYDPYNDPDELAKIATWPREKQPFWYLNRKWISDRQKSQPNRRPETNNVVPSVITRGSFAGQWK